METLQQHDNEHPSLNASAQTFTPHAFMPAPFPGSAFPYVSQGEAGVFMPLPGMYYPPEVFGPPQPPFFDPSVDSPFANGLLEGAIPQPSMNPLAHSFRPSLRSSPPSRSPTNGSTTSSEPPRTPLDSPLSTSPKRAAKQREVDNKSYASMAAKVSKPEMIVPGLPANAQKKRKVDKQAKRAVVNALSAAPLRETKRSLDSEARRPTVQTSQVANDDGWQVAGKRKVSPTNRVLVDEPQRWQEASHNDVEGSRAGADIAHEPMLSSESNTVEEPSLTPDNAALDEHDAPQELHNTTVASEEADHFVETASEAAEASRKASPAPVEHAEERPHPPSSLMDAVDAEPSLEEQEGSSQVEKAFVEPVIDEISVEQEASRQVSTQPEDVQASEIAETSIQEPSDDTPLTGSAIEELSTEQPADASGSPTPFASSSRRSALSQSTSSIPRSSVHGDLSRYAIDEEDDDHDQEPDGKGPPDPKRPRNADEPPSLTLSIFSRSSTLRARFFAILGSIGVNIFLPFVNGVMLGFGEIFAREYVAVWFGFQRSTRMLTAMNQPTANTASVGLRGRGNKQHDVPGHAGAKTAAEAAIDAVRAAAR